MRATTGPTPGRLAQQLVARAPQRTGVQQLVQLPIQLFKGVLQPLDVCLHLGPDRGQGLLRPVLLSSQHAHQLAPTLHQGSQGLLLGVGQRARLGAQRLGKVRPRRGIQRIGLGQAPARLGARRAPGVG